MKVARSAQKPVFSGPEVEGPRRYGAAYTHDRKWAKAPDQVKGTSNYQTELNRRQEKHFRQWLGNHPDETGGFDPNAKKTDYDLRGWWKQHAKAGTLQQATEGKDGAHFTDRYKTPYDTTFSDESQYAKKGTPFVWKPGKKKGASWVLVNRNNGRLIVRESEE